jgi:hypothetical protein
MGVPAIDDSDWPIVRITYAEVLTLDEVPLGAGMVDRIFETRGPMVLVSDVTALNLTAATPPLRRAIAIEADKLTDKGAILGEAVVVRTPAARLLFRAYLWLRTTQAYPIQIFEDQARAEQWARALLAAMKRQSSSELGDQRRSTRGAPR